MSSFREEPLLTISTPEELTERVTTDTAWSKKGETRFRVRCDWMMELIGEIEATGQFPYNSVVQREAEKRLGIAEQDDNGSPLSAVVYCSQCYRRHYELIAAGYSPFTQAMIETAHAAKRCIEFQGGMKCKTREVCGKVYCFKPRARTHALMTGYNTPARIV